MPMQAYAPMPIYTPICTCAHAHALKYLPPPPAKPSVKVGNPIWLHFLLGHLYFEWYVLWFGSKNGYGKKHVIKKLDYMF